MASSSIDSADIPQWKKDLILRRRNQNKQSPNQQLFRGPPQNNSSDALGRAEQPSLTCSPRTSVAVPACGSEVAIGQCKVHPACHHKMVQERVWLEKNGHQANGAEKSDSDSSEDLHYGPGIVNKLKNRYLSLALRENNAKSRPSILHMRKATSLENLLDNDAAGDKEEAPVSRLFETRLNGRSNDTGKNAPNRYRNATRSSNAIMKRAHSVETISRTDHSVYSPEKPKRESMHEDMLIADKDECLLSPTRKTFEKSAPEITADAKVFSRTNKPKRITPIMNEKEKPPADVVKQTKKIFEGRPEQRTRPPHATGEVAAKVATYKSIILQTKVNKKPPIKQKPSLQPAVATDKTRKVNHPPVRLPTTKAAWNDARKTSRIEAKSPTPPLQSPIPDVSKTHEFSDGKQNGGKIVSSLSETPDLILHSSLKINSPTFSIESTEMFVKEEIDFCSRTYVRKDIVRVKTKPAPVVKKVDDEEEVPDGMTIKYISQESRNNISKSSSSITYNFFSNIPQKAINTSSPLKTERLSPTQPLKLEINGLAKSEPPSNSNSQNRLLQTVDSGEIIQKLPSPKHETPNKSISAKPGLTVREIEKNLINSAKSLEQPVKVSVSVDNANKIQVPKVKKPPVRVQEQNSVVFKFTDRKDIPDYVGNVGQARAGKLERPKVRVKVVCDTLICLQPKLFDSINEFFYDIIYGNRHLLIISIYIRIKS